MKDFDMDFGIGFLDFALGANFYVGNAIKNSIDGSEVKYTEPITEPEYLENTGSTKLANTYSDLLSPAPLSDRKHLQ